MANMLAMTQSLASKVKDTAGFTSLTEK